MLMSPVPPSEPLLLSVTEGDEANILISWKQPLQRGPPALTGYKLCFNGTCDIHVEGESAEVSAAHFKQNGYQCYNVTVYAVSESDSVPVKCPYSEHAWIVAGTYIANICMCSCFYDMLQS